MRIGCFVLLVSSGCAGGSGAVLRDPLADRIATSASRAAAPDLVAAAEAALLASARADDEPGRALHRRRAELWLRAAEAEAERVALAGGQAAIQARIDAADARRIADEQALRAVLEAQRRLSLAEVARQAVRRALSLSAELLVRGQRGPIASVPELLAAGDALCERARLLASAAEVLGAPEPGLERARQSIAAAACVSVVAPSPASVSAASAASAASAGARLVAARTALDAANAALGEARAKRPSPDASEIAALHADAADLGLSAASAPGGLALDLGEPFARGMQLSVPGRVALVQVRSLLRAHPHGGLSVQVGSTSTGASARRLAERRAVRLAGLLSVGERSVVTGASPSVAPGQARLVLSAY